MSKKVFITGGTGFLGAYLIKELVEKGYTVRAIHRNKKLPFFIEPRILKKVQWVTGDILDVVSLYEGMEGMDAVIHAAAKVSFHPKERKELFKTNIEGTANVVNAAIENNIGRFLHISSVAAIGRTAAGETVTEEKKWQPSKLNTWYALSKQQAEMEVWRGMGEGLNVVVANPTTILGYGDWNTTSCAIFKTAYNEFPWYTTGVNGFVNVEDVAKASVLLMESEYSGERFIINGDNWSFQQLLNTIADGLGKKRPYKEATPFLGAVAWRMEKLKSLFSGKRPLLTRQSARVAQSKTYFDNQKLLQHLPGFHFTPLAQTIQLASERYKSNVQPL